MATKLEFEVSLINALVEKFLGSRSLIVGRVQMAFRALDVRRGRLRAGLCSSQMRLQFRRRAGLLTARSNKTDQNYSKDILHARHSLRLARLGQLRLVPN